MSWKVGRKGKCLMISIVVAHGHNLVIGKDGWMPWHLPEDLKCFKKITLHHDIVMGRTTFEAMKKPLPYRHTYLVTTQKNYQYQHEDVTVIHDFKQLLESYQNNNNILYICGGAQIYHFALPYVDEMWISLVDQHYDGDTFFPPYSLDDFIVKTKERKAGFVLIQYVRKK